MSRKIIHVRFLFRYEPARWYTVAKHQTHTKKIHTPRCVTVFPLSLSDCLPVRWLVYTPYQLAQSAVLTVFCIGYIDSIECLIYLPSTLNLN